MKNKKKKIKDKEKTTKKATDKHLKVNKDHWLQDGKKQLHLKTKINRGDTFSQKHAKKFGNAAKQKI